MFYCPNNLLGKPIFVLRCVIHRIHPKFFYFSSYLQVCNSMFFAKVSLEMAKRSAHLLDQIQDLQYQLNDKVLPSHAYICSYLNTILKVSRHYEITWIMVHIANTFFWNDVFTARNPPLIIETNHARRFAEINWTRYGNCFYTEIYVLRRTRTCLYEWLLWIFYR